MDALQPAAFLQQFDVPADSHQRNAQLLGEVRNPDHPLALDGVHNGLVTCSGEHRNPFER